MKVIFWGFESPKNTFLDFPLLGDPFLNLFLFGALKHNFPYFNLYDSYKKFHTVKIKNIKKGVGPSDGGDLIVRDGRQDGVKVSLGPVCTVAFS